MKTSLVVIVFMLISFGTAKGQTPSKNNTLYYKASKPTKEQFNEPGVSFMYYDSKNIGDSKFSYTGNPVSYATQNKDTLYLINNELGKLIARVWETDPKPEIYGKKPIIIYVEGFPVKKEKSKNLNIKKNYNNKG